MIKSLTSLRLFFALAVFFSHLAFLKDDLKYSDIYDAIFSEGFLGVSFFFILSGFILALNYEAKFVERRVTYKEYIWGRIARIYPMQLLTMLFALPLAYQVFYKYILFHITLTQSFIPEKDIYFSLNSPSWSISDEMFFYCLLPFLIFLFKNKQLVYVVIAVGIVLILSLNLWLPSSSKHYWLYVSPLIRLVDFFIGIGLYKLYKYLKSIKITLINQGFYEIASIMIFFIFFAFKDTVDISYRYSIYYFVPMCLIILSFALSNDSDKQGLLSKILSNKLLVKGGEISFSFYLWHLLVTQYFQIVSKKMGLNTSVEIQVMAIFIITIVMSYLSFEFIEKHFNVKIKKYFKS
jgi:peptidoglycan/LPS O-acetylase OafA/YrhL